MSHRAGPRAAGKRALMAPLIGGLCAALLLLPLPGRAKDIPVADAAAIPAALNAARPGDRLLLAPGDYGALALWPGGKGKVAFDGPVTFVSADPSDRAVLRSLVLNQARNLVFQNILFDYRAGEGSYKERPFEVKNSSDIAFLGSVFEGDVAHGTGPRGDGFGAGLGLAIRDSDRVRVEGNVIRGFYRGLTMGQSDGSVIRGNDISGMRSDGLNFVKVTNLRIENNHIHDFRRNMAAGDHADMIQFWTTRAETPTTDVVIRGNVLNMGGGDHTQSIFMRNERAEQMGEDRSMFYRNLVIEENVIINGHLHGISVGEADGLTIRRNTLIRVPRVGVAAPTAAQGRGLKHWAPYVRVSKRSRNVQVRDNIFFGMGDVMPGWDVADNLVIQDMALMQPGHYAQVFVNGLAGPPYDLKNFTYRADGPAGSGRIGAARLRGD